MLVSKRVEFCAAHKLCSKQLSHDENVKVFGSCQNGRGHGHNYILDVTVEGPIEPQTGMVINLKDLKQIINDHVISKIDHSNLNDEVFLKGEIPTTENLACAIWEVLDKKLPNGKLHKIQLWETSNNYVTYYGEDRPHERCSESKR